MISHEDKERVSDETAGYIESQEEAGLCPACVARTVAIAAACEAGKHGGYDAVVSLVELLKRELVDPGDPEREVH